TPYNLICASMQALGWSPTEDRIHSYVRQECEIQERITGRPQDFDITVRWLKVTVLTSDNLTSRLINLSTERDALLGTLNAFATERETLIAERDAANIM